MTSWFYLSFGFALFFILREKKGDLSPFLRLSMALIALMVTDFLLTHFLWRPAGRMDLRLISLFLWALLVDGGGGGLFVPLIGFSLWMITREETTPLLTRLTGVLTLPLVTGMVKALLESCLKRLRLADIPRVLEGAPILFFLASLLALAFQGFLNGVRLWFS